MRVLHARCFSPCESRPYDLMSSLFPSICYEWTRPQDLASQHLEVVRRSVQVTIPSGSSFATASIFAVPSDKAFLLQAVVAMLVCNDASSIINMAMLATFGSSDAPFITTNPPSVPGVAGTIRAVSWTGQHIIPPGRILTATIGMQTQQIADQLANLGLSGVLIPRGNVLEA